jgi:bifunctional UDP-N-acetylglucosamine pyrophosphorylase / glucosamine-1-phosphate N-acetyltransferase
MRTAIVLAAGKGTRMKSSLPKVMHPILSESMIEHVMTHLNEIKVDHSVVVVGHGAESVQACLKDTVSYAIQSEQLGTGHAVMQGLPVLPKEGDSLILYGDTPCIQSKTMEWLYEVNQDFDLTVLTAVFEDPARYGRIARDNQGQIEKIVEYKDCTEDQRRINEINTGIYCVKNEALHHYLSHINNNNAANEYYITDLIEIFLKNGLKVQALPIEDTDEVLGVNDRIDLARASKWIQATINRQWMEKGVTFINPEQSYVSINTILEEDVTIYPNVYLEKKTVIKKGTTLLPNTFISNSTIGEYCKVDASRITDSIVKNKVNIGPYAHLRDHCVVEDSNRIGNFVEMKNTQIGFDSRCAHLTYLGDTIVGKKVNFGCGVVTVNYDGKSKFKTIIGDYAFIGSNVNLIAPIEVGENSVVAAGSTITRNVDDTDMAIARAHQINKPGYGLRYKEKK